MATDKIPTMLRLPYPTLHKVKFLAQKESRSVNMQIEHALNVYIEAYEQQHGVIEVPNQPAKD